MENIQVKNKKVKWIKLLIFAQLLDLFSTFVGIGIFGFREVNPIMKNATFFQMALAKILAIVVMSALLYYVKKLPLWVHKLVFAISIVPPILNILQIIIEVIFF